MCAPDSAFMVAECHECGSGVAADVAEAIHCYRRAEAAGITDAAGKLQKLVWGLLGSWNQPDTAG